MTVIVGYTDGKNWAIAADSATTDGDLFFRSTPKIWRRGEYLVGAAGTLQACLWVEECDSGNPYVIAEFMKNKIGDTKKKQFSVLTIGPDGVWDTDSTFTVSPHPDGFWVVGSGREVALGALYVARHAVGWTPKDSVTIAVKASIALYSKIRGPVKVLTS